jgi:hypothetical protein
MAQHIEMAGEWFGRWLVMSRSENNSHGRSMWLCRCNCGTERAVSGKDLRNGKSVSCGCIKIGLKKKHGDAISGCHAPEYDIWCGMRQRCENPNCNVYKHYGGRGIKVCERWQDYPNFLADMGRRPSPDHSIDRYPNNDGDYEPSNCRWAMQSEQVGNRRFLGTVRTRWVHFRGRKITMTEACKEMGIAVKTVKFRLSKGWDIDRALTEPPDKRFSRRSKHKARI